MLPERTWTMPESGDFNEPMVLAINSRRVGSLAKVSTWALVRGSLVKKPALTTGEFVGLAKFG